MKSDLKRIHSFLSQHHVMSLATSSGEELSVCSLFYVYSPVHTIFIVASSEETTHIQNIKINNKVAGNILLETQEIAKIQGVQFRGTFSQIQDSTQKEFYFQKFEYAREMNPILWKIEPTYFKMTDNSLGFGKKIIWTDSSQ